MNSPRGHETDACGPMSCKSRLTCPAWSRTWRCTTTSPLPLAPCCSRWTRPASSWRKSRPRPPSRRSASRSATSASRSHRRSARAKRNSDLGDLISLEAREQSRLKVDQAKGALQAAEAALRQAQVALNTSTLNLERTQVRAPTAGLVTNLDLRRGAHSAGHPVMALVDAGSIYVEGYFEENKLARIHHGRPRASHAHGSRGARGHRRKHRRRDRRP